MLVLPERPAYQLPKIDGKLKPKTIILLTSFVLGLLFYSQSMKPSKVAESSTTNKHSPSYTKWVESLADNYLLLAEQRVGTPGNSCFNLTVHDCLEQLKPEKPKQLKTLEPRKAINRDLKQLGYQARIDAIEYAQERTKDLKSTSGSI